MSSDEEKDTIEGAVIDKLQEVVDKAKIELERVVCPEHGKALTSLNFNRANGSFKIESCCADGEKLLNIAVEQLN